MIYIVVGFMYVHVHLLIKDIHSWLSVRRYTYRNMNYLYRRKIINVTSTVVCMYVRTPTIINDYSSGHDFHRRILTRHKKNILFIINK